MDDGEFKRLLDDAQHGDEVAFATLWRHFNPAMVRFLTTMADRDDAADVASTVWLEVVRELDRFDGDEAGFRSWLFTRARSRMIDLRRAQGRRPQLPLEHGEAEIHAGTEPDPADVAETDLGTDEALAMIGALPANQAEVLLLRIVGDLDVATVAAMLGKRPGTIRVLSHRGLRRLAAQFAVDEARLREVTM